MDLTNDLGVAREMSRTRHGTPSTIEELLTALEDCAATWLSIAEKADHGSQSPTTMVRAQVARSVTLTFQAIITNCQLELNRQADVEALDWEQRK